MEREEKQQEVVGVVEDSDGELLFTNIIVNTNALAISSKVDYGNKVMMGEDSVCRIEGTVTINVKMHDGMNEYSYKAKGGKLMLSKGSQVVMKGEIQPNCMYRLCGTMVTGGATISTNKDSDAYAFIPSDEKTKLKPKFLECKFLGFESSVKCFKLWDPVNRKKILNIDDVLDEKTMPMIKVKKLKTNEDFVGTKTTVIISPSRVFENTPSMQPIEDVHEVVESDIGVEEFRQQQQTQDEEEEEEA
ncbi:unnamed protein product [Prunus armeniaca]